LAGVHAVPATQVPHAPLAQVWPCPHALPHVPQFAASVWRFTHAAPHAVSGALHEVAHAPAAHACPWLHA
jgi:hypothetical protein